MPSIGDFLFKRRVHRAWRLRRASPTPSPGSGSRETTVLSRTPFVIFLDKQENRHSSIQAKQHQLAYALCSCCYISHIDLGSMNLTKAIENTRSATKLVGQSHLVKLLEQLCSSPNRTHVLRHLITLQIHTVWLSIKSKAFSIDSSWMLLTLLPNRTPKHLSATRSISGLNVVQMNCPPEGPSSSSPPSLPAPLARFNR